MELKEDIELLWIADEALQADDPEGWDQAESPNGDTYYIHSVTSQVLWQHPLDYSYQQKYLANKNGVDDDGAPKQPEPKPEPVKAKAAPPPVAPQQPAPMPSGQSSSGSVGDQLAGSKSLISDDQLRARLQQLLGTKHTSSVQELLRCARTFDRQD